MATIQKRVSADGKVSYRAQVRKKGFPPTTATFHRKTDAQKWASDKETEFRQQKHFKYELHQEHTVGDLVDRYIEVVLPTKPKSEQTQRSQLQRWREELGSTPLHALTPAKISSIKDKLAAEHTSNGLPRSGPTVNRYLAVLTHALNKACKEWEWITHNPALAVSKFKESKARDRFLSDEERKRLLAECERSTNPYLKTIVIIAISTGMRRDEIRYLKWPDVQLGHKRVILRDTKNNQTRSVPLHGPALDAIRALNDTRPPHRQYVFPSPNTDTPIDFRNAWRVARKNANLEDVRFHDLRHTAASYLAMNGATATDIAAILGHRTIAMAQRYSHLSETHVQSVVERMNDKVFND
jgi:integrase